MKVMFPISSFVMCEASNSTQGGNSGEKKSFDTFNIQMLEHILQPLSLCSQFSQREVIETFREFQDFIHTNYQGDDFAMHEEKCKRALHIMLYGVIARGVGGNV